MKIIKIIAGVTVFIGAQIIAAKVTNYRINKEIENKNKKSQE